MGNGKSHEPRRATDDVKHVPGDVDDIDFMLTSRSMMATSFQSTDTSFEVDATVVFRGDESLSRSEGTAGSSLRRRLSRRRRVQQPAHWTEAEVIEALGAVELVVSIPAGVNKFAVLEAVGAEPDGVRTFITKGFGHHLELTIRVINKVGDEETILGLRRLANTLARIADTSSGSIDAYKLVDCDLFPWDPEILVGQGKEHGLLLLPDVLLEPLNNRKRKFIALLALQPEEWQLAKLVPSIPLHAFISSETGCANPFLVNSARRPSMLDLGAVEELRIYAPELHPALASQTAKDIDFHARVTSTSFELTIPRSQVTGIFSVLEDQLLGDIFSLKTLRLAPRDTNGERELVFRNRRHASQIDALSPSEIIIDSGDEFYGCLIASVWNAKEEHFGRRGFAFPSDDDARDAQDSNVEVIDLSAEFGGSINFKVRVVSR
ncbi:Hypothetical Protein FCC1311_044182 [Hondaea fermentalgiana]|uniref:Uncharacterized protein n=1 Tax=Hondaea fermentalgiana TaxID=2315210 RepID=A0A2R5GCB1_9STRA|nr:Hypothetical Protein FCC1311_044182 [Hondaea fermentalgiana]|eukprot:GBG28195.1 Hypothetical Protein FCC1311_044182 [Hondaea fermentalgiana]